MNIRDVMLEDEPIIKEWLNAPQDCENVTGNRVYSSEMFYSWYKAHDQMGYMFEEDSESVAFGEIWVDEEEKDLEIAHLVVKPSARNRGIGKRFIQKLLEKCKDYPYEWVFLRIEPKNEQALQCYKGVGFVEDPSLRTTFNSKWVWMKKRNYRIEIKKD
ncbi:GNAT family N-acetyltransferase [Fictibacillus nanhaiensis]|uniref:GNAT family N-acetyltransferase n=1 Tax=Fictibacillus nanhaiensis TaxID=742169 RepID=UPI001C975A0C|nr:GNAT family N-acetyltransferase [Fictibacillus nanhaiensis]MBY6036900.1 GNAT family N-acetyltransferase [Fictibacillus nanhaiensis]